MTTAAFTFYLAQQDLNNNVAYTHRPLCHVSSGPGVEHHARARPYSSYLFQKSSTNIQTADQYSWYADLGITHQPTLNFLSYSLDVGRELVLGVHVRIWWKPRKGICVRSINWQVIKDWDFTTSGFGEHGDQGVGSTGSLPQATSGNGSYDWYGGGVSLQHALTDRLNASLDYRLRS